jgi:membrane fusion protein (multidrug efflux system)
MNRINKRWSAMAISCWIVCVLGCSSAEPKPPEEPVAPATLVTELFSLTKEKLPSVLQIPGELIAYQQVDLYAKVNSFVQKLYADVGSEVKAGQILALMDAPEINSQLAGAQSKLKSIEATYLAVKANYDRLYQTSQTPGTVSQNDIEQALAKKNSSEADLEAAKSAYREIADNKQYLEIRAPFAGVITARNVHPGAYVGPSGKGSELPLFTLQEQKKLRLVISIPEIYTGQVKNMEKVLFTVKSMPDRKFDASVNRLAGALDSKLRSERIEMDVVNEEKKLLPGMVAEVNIPLASDDSNFVIPKTAFVNSTEKKFVIRVKDKKAEWVEVEKGREAGNFMVVYGKLSPGDQLVKIASEEIRNGSTLDAIKPTSSK